MYRGNRQGGGLGPTPPVKVGEEIDVTIEAVGEKGDGIAKKNGFVLFIPGVKEGQQVKIRVTKVLRKVGFAEVIGEGSAPAEAPAEAAEAPAEEAPVEEAPADSESFGEEEAPAEEAPVEEASEEALAEEAPEEAPAEPEVPEPPAEAETKE